MGRRTKNHASSYPIMCMYLKFSHQFDFMLVSAFYVEVFFLFFTLLCLLSLPSSSLFFTFMVYIFFLILLIYLSHFLCFSYVVILTRITFMYNISDVWNIAAIVHKHRSQTSWNPKQLKGGRGGSVCEGRYQPNIYCIS